MTGEAAKPTLDLLRAGRYQEASRWAQRALEAPGLGIEDRLELTAALADANWHAGDLAQAESHLRQAVELAEKELGADHIRCRISRYSLASFLSAQGRSGQAVEVLRQLPDARPIDDALRALALSDLDPKRRDEARAALARALGGGGAAQQEVLAVLQALLSDEEAADESPPGAKS